MTNGKCDTCAAWEKRFAELRTQVKSWLDQARDGGMQSMAESSWKGQAFQEVLDCMDGKPSPLEKLIKLNEGGNHE